MDLSEEEDGRLVAGVCRSGNAASSDGQVYIFHKTPLTGAFVQETKLVPPLLIYFQNSMPAKGPISGAALQSARHHPVMWWQ